MTPVRNDHGQAYIERDSRKARFTMSLPPLLLSDLIIQHPEVSSFVDLLATIRKRAEEGDRFMLEVNLKPDFPDTPRNWEFLVESAFVWGER